MSGRDYSNRPHGAKSGIDPLSKTGKIKPLLVLACGNPSRGDDALGPLLIERLELLRQAGELPQVDLLQDFQLQIEHALDLGGRELVIFVDAAAEGPEPFFFEPVGPEKDAASTTHAMTPGAVLRVFGQVTREEAPAARLLAIRGYAFDLGSPLSQAASENLEKAFGALVRFLGSR